MHGFLTIVQGLWITPEKAVEYFNRRLRINGSYRRIDDIDKVERLHVLIGSDCNNNCIFCMEEDREGRRRRMQAIAPMEIRQILAANAFRQEVIFTGGEPTLNPYFLQYVRWAKEFGYTLIGVCTNGRRLAYSKYTAVLIKAGLNHFVVSVHGPDAATHDALTRTRGSFEQSLAGLRILKALQRVTRLDIHTSTVINTRNFKLMGAIYATLSPYVDQVVFNVLQPWGRGFTFFKRLMPRYSEVAAEFASFLKGFQAPPRNVFLLDIPYCVTEGLGIPEHNRGFNERRAHYDKLPDSPDYWPESDIQVKQENLVAGGAPKKVVLKKDAMELEELLFVHHRDDQDRQQRIKRPQCRDCRFEPICDGVWKAYVQRYGWDEFTPVKK